MIPAFAGRLCAAAALVAVTGLTGSAPSSATPTPSHSTPAADTVPCTSQFIRTHTAVRVRQRPGLNSPTLRVIPARHYVLYHAVKEEGWYRVAGSLPGKDNWWFGFISPTDPHTGKTIASDGWTRTGRCVPGSRIPAPTPVNSPLGRTIHRL